MSGDTTASVASLIIFILLVIYVVGGSFMEKKKFIIGHETGIAIIIGFLISLGIKLSGREDIESNFQFSPNVFFYFCLPPILFSSGFNMRRKRFFDNIGYILLFGLFGTLITFVIFSGLTYGFIEAGIIWKYNGTTGEYTQLTLSIMECLLVSSLLCSSDVIAAISIIKYEEQPKLFSLVFGEGIVNDAVAIILFHTVSGFTGHDGDNESFVWSTPFKIIGDFLLLGSVSIIIGLVFGLIASYIIKICRFVTVSAIKETLLIFCFGYISYSVSELLSMSGIISLLTSGVIMAHYAWYSLSPQGKHVSSVAFQVVGFGAEAFVFGYLGLAFFSYAPLTWSWQLILVEMLIILIGRFMGTVGLISFMVLCGHKKKVTFRELFFISYSGLIRGAIAFGLVVNIDSHGFQDKDVILTTTLTLVVVTTVIFGSLMPLVQRVLLGRQEHKHPVPADIKINGSDEHEKEHNEQRIADERKFDVSEHEEFLHPNMMHTEMDTRLLSPTQIEVEKKTKKKNTCGKYFMRFDEFIMRPIFIYNYQHDMAKRKDDFQDLFEKEGDKWEQVYLNEVQKIDDIQKSRIQSMMARSAAASKVGGTHINNKVSAKTSHAGLMDPKYTYKSVIDPQKQTMTPADLVKSMIMKSTVTQSNAGVKSPKFLNSQKRKEEMQLVVESEDQKEDE